MRILVTGGGGFLGRHIVKQLQQRGDEVRVIGRRPYSDLVEAGVECVQGDITETPRVIDACRGMDAVIHVAARAGVWGPRESYYQPNVTGTINVIAGCREAGVRRLVYTSTPSVVYGTQPIEGGDESLPYPERYLTHYAETKAMAERAVLAASDGTLATCSLRPHLIWGPGDTNLVPRIVQRAKAGKLKQVGDGTNRVSVSYVENVAAAHVAAVDRLRPGNALAGQAYFINEDEPVRCWTFIGKILHAMDAPPIRKSVPFAVAYTAGCVLEATHKLLRRSQEPLMTRFVALQLATSHWFRADKAKRDLDWRPTVSLDEGLRRMASARRR